MKLPTANLDLMAEPPEENPFASLEDVEARYTAPLTDAQKSAATYVLEASTGLIAEVAGKNVTDFDPVPFYFKVLCVEKAVSALSNPSNVASQSETLGSWSHSETFPQSLDAAAFLTDDEERRIRRISKGIVSSSTRTKSLLHDTIVREPTS